MARPSPTTINFRKTVKRSPPAAAATANTKPSKGTDVATPASSTEPSTCRSNSSTTTNNFSPSLPSSDSSPAPTPTIKELPESTVSFRTPIETSRPSMTRIDDFLDPEESEEAKNYAATAKKVLLRRTADYIAYLNALLKAHAVEEILSRSEGIDAIVNELLCFLAMKALDKRPVPSVKIHRAWRVMVQTRPLAYIEMCKAMGASSGFAIDDENFDPDDDEKDSLHTRQSNVFKERYESTRIAYTALFQSKPPSEFWPSSSGDVGEICKIPENHLEFLNEENLPRDEDIFCEFGSDTATSVSSMGFEDDSLATMEPAALLNELQYLAKEQNIDIANLSYDSIVNDIKRMRLWVDKTFF